jgi:hypothetical protein
MLTAQQQAVVDSLARRTGTAPQMSAAPAGATSPTSPQMQAMRDALARRGTMAGAAPTGAPPSGLQSAMTAAQQMGAPAMQAGPGVANAMNVAHGMGYRPPAGVLDAIGLPAPAAHQFTAPPPRDELTEHTAKIIADMKQRQQSGAAAAASGRVQGMAQGRGVFAGGQQAAPMPVRPPPNLFGGG